MVEWFEWGPANLGFEHNMNRLSENQKILDHQNSSYETTLVLSKQTFEGLQNAHFNVKMHNPINSTPDVSYEVCSPQRSTVRPSQGQEPSHQQTGPGKVKEGEHCHQDERLYHCTHK